MRVSHAAPDAVRRPRRWRPLGAAACAALLGVQAACYSYQPLQFGAVPSDRRVAVVLNDSGRAALAERVGSAMEYLDGRVVGTRGDSLVLSVFKTRDLRGDEARWTGEAVAIPNTGIAGYRNRAISKSRSLLLTATMVGVFLVVTSRSLDVFGDPKGEDPVPPPDDS